MPAVRKINLKNNSIPSSPTSTLTKVLDHHHQAPGIVTILRSDCEGTKAAASIRRTLSADMSSKKWLEQNGFISPINKIVSSHQVLLLPDHSSSSSESEEDEEEEEEEAPGQDDVWRSIQAEKEKNNNKQTTGVWGTMNILTQKSDESSAALPPPYVHPLVKRSASTLSYKSLEICTESLGSETGSDCFSSEILSDGDNGDEDIKNRVVIEELKDEKNLLVAKYKKSPVRPFPPPLASIAGGGDGAALHMHSHRENGRLVVEAVSVPPRNYFRSQRSDGRLVLTLIHAPKAETTVEEENRVEEFEKVFDDIEDVPVEDDGGGAEAEEEEEEMEQKLSVSLPSGMMSVTKTGLVMKKLMNMNMNMNSKWTKTEVEAEEVFPIPQSLPPPPPRVARLIPPPAAAASFNAYDYFWRKAAVAQPKHDQELVVKKKQDKKTEYSVPPYMRGCKEARMRSLLIWEPHCIATS